jgi:methylenetetrahydrofolate reductase (NADPH)
MKVVEHLADAGRPRVSVEVIPPRRGGDVQRIYDAVGSVLPFDPPFIDITSHAAEAVWDELPDGTFRRRVTRKAPGTFGLCAAIKYRYGIDPVAHVLCAGFTREETEDALIELNYLGIENLLAIRGDGAPRALPDGRSANESGLDLVRQIAAMNAGRYLEELKESTPTSFCVGVAAYPEKHPEAPNMAWDIEILRQKQEAGAGYAVTQIFYDAQRYLRFVRECRSAGVTIPILPGLKILTRREQVSVVPKVFGVDVPSALVDEVRAAKDQDVAEVGIRWAYDQTLELFEAGVPLVHFYVMQNTRPFVTMMERVQRSL